MSQQLVQADLVDTRKSVEMSLDEANRSVSRHVWYTERTIELAKFHRSDRLGKQDDQFQLRIGQVCRNVCGQVAGALNRLPRNAGLAQAEVLIIELDRNGAGRLRDIGERHAEQGVFHQVIDVVGGTDLDQLRYASDDISLAGLGADREVHLGVLQVLVVVECSSVDKGLRQLEGQGDEVGGHDGFEQVA